MPQTYIKQRGALGTAVFSPDKKYRYVLTRGNPRMRRAVWVMLNPSQADQHKNDHTITKCVEFSRRWGFPGIFVVNLYALVSTDPSVLLTSPDPIGLMNDAWLRRAKQYASAYDVPVMAAGGVMTGAEAAALLGPGATAVPLGIPFLTCPEAGTAPVHAHALTTMRGTTVTRAFSGRSARALATTWTELYSAAAPAAYPHVHHVTAPLRALGKANGETELVHLWAGTGHERLRPMPAAQLARTVRAELDAAQNR